MLFSLTTGIIRKKTACTFDADAGGGPVHGGKETILDLQIKYVTKIKMLRLFDREHCLCAG